MAEVVVLTEVGSEEVPVIELEGPRVEVLVTAAEATVYCVYMKRLQAGYDNERYIIGYTAVANVTSFVAGLIFALIFPYIF